MEKTKFENRSILGIRRIDLGDQEIEVRLKHLIFGEKVKRFKLDQLNLEYNERTMNFPETGCLLVFLIAGIIIGAYKLDIWFNINPLLLFGLLIILFFLPRIILKERIIEFKTIDEPIFLYSNIFNRKKVEVIASTIVERAKVYIVDKYGYIDPDLSMEEQFKNYRWLLQNNFITPEKYEELKSKLKNMKKDDE